MTSTVLTNIGELVTNDPEAADLLGIVEHAALVVEGGQRRLGRPGRPTHPPPTSWSTSAAAPCSPASSTATATWSSPATGRRSSPPGWPGESYAAGGIRTTVAATRAATDEELDQPRRPAGRRDAPPGHHHRRDQERLRPHRARRGPRPRGRAAVHRGDDVPRRARRARRQRPRGVRRPGDRPDARGRRARTPAGSTCSASAAPSTTTRPAGSSRPAPPPGCGAGCTPTSSVPGPGVRLAAELGLARRRPLHLPRGRGRRRAPRLRHHRDPAAGRRVLHAAALPRRPPADRRRRPGRDRQRLQPRLLLHQLAAALHRARGPRDGDDARPRRCTPRRTRGARPWTATTSARWSPAGGRT